MIEKWTKNANCEQPYYSNAETLYINQQFTDRVRYVFASQYTVPVVLELFYIIYLLFEFGSANFFANGCNCLLHHGKIINSQIILPNADFYDPALHFASILHPAKWLATRSDYNLVIHPNGANPFLFVNFKNRNNSYLLFLKKVNSEPKYL